MVSLKARVSAFSRRFLPPWWLVILLVAAGLTIYFLVGHQIVDAVYKGEASWIDAVLGGRAVTPVEAYYRSADELVLRASLWLVLGYAAAWAVLREPVGMFLFAVSLVFTSFLLFWFFETFPSLIKPFGLNAVSAYYAYKTNYLPDPELGFREKPFNRAVIHNFAGARYDPIFDINLARMTIEWHMDGDGFRNARDMKTSNIVLLGDSYLEYGSDQDDTFGARLERELPGVTVRNLGKSGYSPFQYLVVLQRYGLKYKPRYAVMAIYEGNDIVDTRKYLLWKTGEATEGGGFLYRFATASLLRRYWAAAAATVVGINKTLKLWRQLFLHRIAQKGGYAYATHPDIAHLNLEGTVYRKLFIDQFTERSTTELLASEEFSALKKIFGHFRDLCRANGIVPIVLYIPAAAQVYAKYSTKDSGANWLRQLETQIAVSHNTEKAVSALVREARIDFVSLTQVFGQAAEEGKMVYYALDAHWNAEGRQIAARFVAQMFRSKYLHAEIGKPN